MFGYRKLLHSSFGHIIKETLSYASTLQSFSFSHTLQQGSSLTHALAQRARNYFLVLVWMESIPPYLYDCFVQDFAAII